MTVDYRVGDTREVIATIPDGSVDLVATSPPFYQLRSYVPAEHASKAMEIGSEPDPATFLDTLLELTAEWGRVLAAHGSIAIELGDTYSGSGGGGGDYLPGGIRDGQPAFGGSARASNAAHWRAKNVQTGSPKAGAKSLVCIPDLYTIALAYGINPLTGKESPAGKWLVRNKIVWHRPNPAVGALGDKVRPSTSYIVVATRSAKRWFDLTAVRSVGDRTSEQPFVTARHTASTDVMSKPFSDKATGSVLVQNPAGAPPLDCWFDAHDGTHDTTTNKRTPAELVAVLRDLAECEVDHEAADLIEQLTTDPYDGSHDTWTLTTQPSKLPHYACVDDQTQALTRDGWKYHHKLRDGEAIAGYNRDSKTISWQAATFHRYDFDGDLVAIDKRTTSQRLTPNHRVLVSDRNGSNERVVLAEDLKPGHQVPLAAPFNDDRTPTIGKALMEMIGWYITEGTERLHTVDIYQSATVNEANCKRIAWLLDEVGATYTVTDRQRNTLSAHVDWTERRWTISGHVAAVLKDLAPAKRLTADIVFRSSHSELRALLDGLIGGDGHTRANGRRSFIQQSPETMDMVQALCCRLGIRSTIGQNTAALTLTLGSRTATTLRGTNGKHEPIGREHYTGIVWCPSVPSTFWLARRNGRPFITGNTWPAKLAERLVLMMCPREVCRVCGEPRRRMEDTGEVLGRGRTSRNYDTQVLLGEANVNGYFRPPDNATRETLGWTDCGHGTFLCAHDEGPNHTCRTAGDNFRPGLVLDPFAGSGTTLAVADLHGRDAIGIDFDARNKAIYPARYDEVKRALFGTPAPMPGQGDLFAEVPA